jgi:hypothetical protein
MAASDPGRSTNLFVVAAARTRCAHFRWRTRRNVDSLVDARVVTRIARGGVLGSSVRIPSQTNNG